MNVNFAQGGDALRAPLTFTIESMNPMLFRTGPDGSIDPVVARNSRYLVRIQVGRMFVIEVVHIQ